MKVFNHSQETYEKIFNIEKYEKNSNYEYKESIDKKNKETVEIIFHSINPPKDSKISLYSNSLKHIIYIGEYRDRINITIPKSVYKKENGLDAIDFFIYNYNTGDIYVLEQEKPYTFWKEDTIVNINFLPKREYYNDEFALFIGYTVTLDPITQ
ncbi:MULTISPECIES: hypothetical protein [unclassified Psychrobacter]|uniref:hypothetical protein n=1 Tax=unclassified Psychrobacter TaxID=196806 RepID=UPI0018F46DF3|nr:MULTISPECIES: hypothetical protein [unclassified Psychrobacter]